ncbi:HopJ type III effector protein [Reinekea forsetii]|nr:HopJ type III effector protein [Reinekea forsetii]
MTLKELLAVLHTNPESLVFSQVLEAIDSEFEFTPSAFTNGKVHSQASENQGSCKVFAFANQAGLSQAHTLKLFAEHYTEVLENVNGTSHQNIRAFMKSGWKGISFEKKNVLVKK